MKYHQPYIPMHISGDDEGNARRQAAADRINATQDRTVDGAKVVRAFDELLKREGLDT